MEEEIKKRLKNIKIRIGKKEKSKYPNIDEYRYFIHIPDLRDIDEVWINGDKTN